MNSKGSFKGGSNFSHSPSFAKKSNSKLSTSRFAAPLPVNLPSLRKEQANGHSNSGPNVSSFSASSACSLNQRSRWVSTLSFSSSSSSTSSLSSSSAGLTSQGFLNRKDFPSLLENGSVLPRSQQQELPSLRSYASKEPFVPKRPLKVSSDEVIHRKDDSQNQNQPKLLLSPLVHLSHKSSNWVDDDRDTGQSCSGRRHNEIPSTLPRELDFGGGLNGKAWLPRKSRQNSYQFMAYDPERESFEAELEKVQRMLEEERRNLAQANESALELVKRQQEERNRLAREEQQRRQRILEEAARERDRRAEQEALEIEMKMKEKRAREEENRKMLEKEERRKEAARQKLLELEKRIVQREAEKKGTGEPTSKQSALPSLNVNDNGVSTSCSNILGKENNEDNGEHTTSQCELGEDHLGKSTSDVKTSSHLLSSSCATSLETSSGSKTPGYLKAIDRNVDLPSYKEEIFKHEHSIFSDEDEDSNKPEKGNGFLSHPDGHSGQQSDTTCVNQLFRSSSPDTPLLSRLMANMTIKMEGISDSSSLFNANFEHSLTEQKHLTNSLLCDENSDGHLNNCKDESTCVPSAQAENEEDAAIETKTFNQRNDHDNSLQNYLCLADEDAFKDCFKDTQEPSTSNGPDAFSLDIGKQHENLRTYIEGYSTVSEGMDLKHVICELDSENIDRKNVGLQETGQKNEGQKITIIEADSIVSDGIEHSESLKSVSDNSPPIAGYDFRHDSSKHVMSSEFIPSCNNILSFDVFKNSSHSQFCMDIDTAETTDQPVEDNARADCSSFIENCMSTVKEVDVEGIDNANEISCLNDRSEEMVMTDSSDMCPSNCNSCKEPIACSEAKNAEIQDCANSQSASSKALPALQMDSLIEPASMSEEKLQSPLQIKFGEFPPAFWLPTATEMIHFGSILTFLYPCSQTEALNPSSPNILQPCSPTTTKSPQKHTDHSVKHSINKPNENDAVLVATTEKSHKEMHTSQSSKPIHSNRQSGRDWPMVRVKRYSPEKQSKAIYVPKAHTSVQSSLTSKGTAELLSVQKKQEYKFYGAAGKSFQKSKSHTFSSKSYLKFDKNTGLSKTNYSKNGQANMEETSTTKIPDQTVDVPMHSGVVHVFEQPGISVQFDEDGFITVRSKRQMLNEKRKRNQKPKTIRFSKNSTDNKGSNNLSFQASETMKQITLIRSTNYKAIAKEKLMWRERTTPKSLVDANIKSESTIL